MCPSTKNTAGPESDPVRHATAALIRTDPYLKPYEKIIRQRLSKIRATEKRLTGENMTLADVASGHEHFGLHRHGDQWVFREWAPMRRPCF